MAPTALIGLDIETDTSVAGLDPEIAPIVAAAVCSADGRDEHVFQGMETTLIRDLDRTLARLPPSVLVTWNGAAFDLPFLRRRAEILGLTLGLRAVEDRSRHDRRHPGRPSVRARWYGHVHLDGYLLYRSDVGNGLGMSCALKNLSRLVGLEPDELDRSRIHQTPPEVIRRYVASDARAAAILVERRMPRAVLAADHSVPGATVARELPHPREADGGSDATCRAEVAREAS